MMGGSSNNDVKKFREKTRGGAPTFPIKINFENYLDFPHLSVKFTVVNSVNTSNSKFPKSKRKLAMTHQDYNQLNYKLSMSKLAYNPQILL
jgi:hypothetical protein